MDSSPKVRVLPAPTTVSAGDLLAGRYRLQALLGRGGMADVFGALDEVLHRQVAVKVFRPQDLSATEVSRRQAEVRLLASLNHPGLVTVHDAGTCAGHDDTTFLVMELVAGPALSLQVETHGRLPSAQVATLGAQVAGALAYVHGRNLIHRDVKPGNILLSGPVNDPDRTLVAKLADFGIARLVDATRLTATGTMIGTAPYMSPEQVRGGTVGPPTDVYALGLVLLECLTGTVAYPGHALESAVARLHRSPDIPRDLGTGWRDLLASMTADDPAQRPSAERVAETLTADFGGHTTGQTTGQTTGHLTGHRSGQTHPGRHLGTQVLSSADAVAKGTKVQPAPPGGSHSTLDTGPRMVATAAAVIALLLLAFGLLLWQVRSNATPQPPTPSYPAVTGRLGTDLNGLQEAIRP